MASEFQRVERDPVKVLCVREPGDPADEPEIARRAWEQLESRLQSLRGRKFYGLYYPERNEYLACVESKNDDDPAGLRLEEETVPGGTYLRSRLQGEPEELYPRIGPAFEQLLLAATADPSRPSAEFYRRRDQVDLLLPIAD